MSKLDSIPGWLKTGILMGLTALGVFGGALVFADSQAGPGGSLKVCVRDGNSALPLPNGYEVKAVYPTQPCPPGGPWNAFVLGTGGGPAAVSEQIIGGNSADEDMDWSADDTQWICLDANNETTSTNCSSRFPMAGAIDRLWVRVENDPANGGGTQTLLFTLLVDTPPIGVSAVPAPGPTTLSCSISESALECANDTATACVNVAVNDYVLLLAQPSGNPSDTEVRWTARFRPGVTCTPPVGPLSAPVLIPLPEGS